MYTLFIALIKQFLFISHIKTKAFARPLSNKEEKDCFEELAKGNLKAREKLINHNLRLVAHVAKKYENHMDDMEDLISIGTIGLIKAIDSYQPTMQTKLATYAGRCINNEILMHLRTNKKRALDVSLNERVGMDKDGSDIVLEDVIEAPQIDLNALIETDDQIKSLHQYLSVLEPREKEILIYRYGLFNQDELTQKEIAKKYHISRSYVSRIEKRALVKLLKEFKKAN